ncbi:MAG: hypothetical protein LUM44_13335 [Pyrinomonadaceae bacterium]|nr:hypothetical protein [Pyrinomonadaceae bacterium]
MKSSLEFFFNNWKFILYFALMAVIAPFTIYSILTTDKDLSDSNLRYDLAEQLAKEMKGIPKPPKTVENKFENNAKDFKILVLTRYRTELSVSEINEYFTRELEKRNWKFKKKVFQNLEFCRDKQSAVIEWEGSGGIFGDGGNYFNLSFSKGLVKCG